jgi:hypothetical protein
LILPDNTGAGFRRRGLVIDRSQDSLLPQAMVRMKNELHELAQIFPNPRNSPRLVASKSLPQSCAKCAKEFFSEMGAPLCG